MFFPVALSAVFSVFLSVLLCVVGFNENLVGIALEVNIAADADVILENEVSVDIAEPETDGPGEVAFEATSSIVQNVGLKRSNPIRLWMNQSYY